MKTNQLQQESLRRNLNNASREAISKGFKGVRLNPIKLNSASPNFKLRCL